MFCIVPAIDGVPQVDVARVIVGVSLSSDKAVAIIDGPLQPGWTELTEEEYLELGGVIPQPIEPQPSQEQRIAQLEQVIDTLLTGGETV